MDSPITISLKSYRTIVSYDGSELLKEFSLCILQKNNIFQCDAKIPTLPKVEPLKIWRDVPLSHETAQNLLMGHLDGETALEVNFLLLLLYLHMYNTLQWTMPF